MRHRVRCWHFILAQDTTSTFSVFQRLLVTALIYVHNKRVAYSWEGRLTEGLELVNVVVCIVE